MMIRLFSKALDAISRRGRRPVWRSSSWLTAAATCSLSVTSTTWLSGPCSAWESRSAATKAGRQVLSASTITSDGPAGMSMDTPPYMAAYCLAACTY